MTVKHIGRPSKAVARRLEILDATRRVVSRDGLASLTVTNVAIEADVQRTLVFHYFGDREKLIADFIDQTVTAYGDAQILGHSGDLAKRLDAVFAPGFYRSGEDLAIWQELIALATRDDAVRRQLRNLWQKRWLPEIEHEIAEEFPKAQKADVSAVAYALAGLAEAHWAFQAQGLTQRPYAKMARAMADELLETLR